MKLMKNKWFIFALMWFGLIVYGLLRESPPNGVSLFPHFDKVAHFLLFFCQTWLLARAFLVVKIRVPYMRLWGIMLILALGTECAQATFTSTRHADFWDGVADMFGTSIALLFAQKASEIFTRQSDQKKGMISII